MTLTAHLELDTKIDFDIDKLSNIFTDRVDASLIISLDEYGIARDPVTGFTILGKNDRWDYTVITLGMVKEELENQNSYFFEYIGSSKFVELRDLNNDYLATLISSMMNYNNPWDYIPYNLTINSVIELFIAGYNQGRY